MHSGGLGGDVVAPEQARGALTGLAELLVVAVVARWVVGLFFTAAVALFGGGLEFGVERADLGVETLDRLGVHPQGRRVRGGLQRGFVPVALLFKALEPREGFLNPVFRGHS